MVPNSFLLNLIALLVGTNEELADVSAVVVLQSEDATRVKLLPVADFNDVVVNN